MGHIFEKLFPKKEEMTQKGPEAMEIMTARFTETPPATPEFLKREFLYDYFFFDSTVGISLSKEGRREVYDLYARLFTVTEESWLNTCFDAAEHELARAALTGDEVNRLLRCAELYDGITATLSPILPFKLKAAQRRDTIFEKDSPFEITHTLYSLEKASAEGNVPATGLLAFLALEGYLSETEKEENETRLFKAMRWGSPLALLLICRHFPERKAECSMLLSSLLSHRGEKEVYTYLTKELSLPTAAPSPVAEALEEAFERKILSRSAIGAETLRIIDSAVLTEGSKRDLILTDPKLYPHTLPLGITKKSAPLSPKKLPEGVFKREKEDSLIENNLLYRLSKRKRPLLLVAKDDIVLRSFKERITEAYPERGFCSIDLSGVGHGRIEDTVLRTLDGIGESGPLLFLENCETVEESEILLLSKLLRDDTARHYVTSSGHTLDLSEAVTVLLAHEKPENKLTALCDTVILESVKSSEAEAALDKMLTDCARAFSLLSVTAEQDARTFLLARTANTAERLIEHAVLSNRTNEERLTISLHMLSEDGAQTETKIGIWGGIGHVK